MKQFKECMSMHVNMESYYKSKAEFYQKQVEVLQSEYRDLLSSLRWVVDEDLDLSDWKMANTRVSDAEDVVATFKEECD